MKIKLASTENFGKKFRSIREDKKLTVTQLGMPQSTVTAFENSVCPDVKVSTIVKYAKGLGLNKIVINL